MIDGLGFNLMHRSISPSEAKTLALNAFQYECEKAAAKWLLYENELQFAAEQIMEPVYRMLTYQEYRPCLKAGFFAALYSPHQHGLVTRIESTTPPANSTSCRWGNQCLRTMTGIGGDRYDNCISVHAAQWLDVPQGFDPASLLWMEAGAVLIDGRYQRAAPTDDPLSRVYRCSMCLKTMAGKGIVYVCSVYEDGWVIAPIEATLNTLVICNVADMMAKK